MNHSLPVSTFKRATIFESGYVHGYRKLEVRQIRFHIAKTADGREYQAATFVRRRGRKDETLSAARIVAIGGWDLPALESDLVVVSSGTTVRTAKFAAGSPDWNGLLDAYLTALGSKLQRIFDGRTLPQLEERAVAGRPTIRRAQFTPETVVPEDAPAASVFHEGRVVQSLVDRYERDPDARRACIDHYGYVCQICETNMADIYGSLGEGVIDVHHRTPLSEIRETYVVDPIRDLIPVCPNCHAILHRGTTTVGAEYLAEILRKQRR